MEMVSYLSIQLLLLIIIANAAPVLAHIVFGEKYALPVDFGKKLPDGEPIFGNSKTWRGIIAAVLLSSVVGVMLGHAVTTGALIACYAVIGDIFSSFIKRRMHREPSSMALVLDQVPESLLPAIMMMGTFRLDLVSVAIVVFCFIIAELLLSYVFFRLGIRNRPY